jgi:hypothetical protein
MKTDRLIDLLSTNVEPVERGRLGRILVLALIVGAIVAFCLMLAILGLRSGIADPGRLGFLGLKLLFMLSVIGIGGALLFRLMRPGREARRAFAFLFIPFAVVGVAAILALCLVHSAAWPGMVLGSQWAACALCIPVLAVIPFACLVLALRQAAPTNLQRTGAIAGAVAAALGGAAYAFHCPDDALPFIALWYTVPIALWAVIGAKLGPRLLRW